MAIRELMTGVYMVFEVAVVLFIVGGFVFALGRAARRLAKRDLPGAYSTLRVTFGRSILLGLEVLIAADIIRTIVIEQTLANLAVLAALIAIRTLLSWALEVEIDGRWPWNRADSAA